MNTCFVIRPACTSQRAGKYTASWLHMQVQSELITDLELHIMPCFNSIMVRTSLK